MIAEAEIAAGLLTPSREVDVWIDSPAYRRPIDA